MPASEGLVNLLGDNRTVPGTAYDSVRAFDPYRPLGGVSKRCMDLLLSIAILVVLSPVILAVAALIRFRLGGPVISAQQTVGFGGRIFTRYSFNTMSDDAASAGCLGNVLHKSGLGELPQLFNVVRGDMSLVGPRPMLPYELASYGRYARQYCRARPGITGLWQTNGGNRISRRSWLARDRYYVCNWSLRLDAGLLLKAVKTSTMLD